MESETGIGLIGVTVLLTLYFLPTIVAGARAHHQTGAIFALDLLLGWTLLGWVAALVWSFTAIDRNDPGAARRVEGRFDAHYDETKTCPDCAELVKRGARKCRFCGHEFTVADSPSVP